MGSCSQLEYVSVGGNRHPSAADWTAGQGGLLAYGAGNSIALWSPLAHDHSGVFALLNGHSNSVTAITFIQQEDGKNLVIVSGSADKKIRAWKACGDTFKHSRCTSHVVGEHDASITNLAFEPVSRTMLSAASDSTIKVWKCGFWDNENDTANIEPLETIRLQIMPLALAIHQLDNHNQILAVAGSHSTIQIHVTQARGSFKLVATLAGHAGWIRSLSFVRETDESSPDLLLSSASQDKFIRLWRIHKGDTIPTAKAVEDPSLGILGRSMSTKAHRFSVEKEKVFITFEALLLGHDDWIYSNRWHRHKDRLQLLSASADNSLAIWEADPHSGIWVCVSRLGEISAQKGSTTATGSTGGFWIGLWSPDGNSAVSLGRTGSWRIWKREDDGKLTPGVGCGGHVRSVTDIAWSKNGDYLLSTSSDQTTRLHAEWKRENQSSWHEFARPQIHGYDLNCIDVITDSQFVSGADEKPLRVFQEPAAVAEILQKLCGISTFSQSLPDAANIPVLGLSNKAITMVADNEMVDDTGVEGNTEDSSSILHKSTLDIAHPPIEDTLARHLLWPEIHKVYGHGYEISAVSVTNDGSLMATACRASSIDHAVIRIYAIKDWREFTSPLRAHSLTVTDLKWSPDGRYLLSVGRDRMWSVFKRNGNEFSTTTIKGHSRMILGCSWAPLQAGLVFATAGRDKCVKLWQKHENDGWQLKNTISLTQPVTAVAFSPLPAGNYFKFAMGLEDGQVLIASMVNAESVSVNAVARDKCPNKTVNTLAWRPENAGGEMSLAAASEDGSLRILRLE